jgi:farnesyl-diphosphate farnesyltransferase
MRSTNPRDVAYMFRDSSRTIHAKTTPNDPNFLQISVACCKVSIFHLQLEPMPIKPSNQIEQWCEHHYPSFVRISQATSISGSFKQLFNPSDARARIFELDQKREADAAPHKLHEGNGVAKANTKSKDAVPLEVILYVLAAFAIVLGGSLAVVYGILFYLGDA